ncbi:uncharacterized protein LOC108630395, partial [Ceratina calcarata]|uniref:Uncharacterized protein LOC108630395 n=1 Tax=Ceratina calcarata TaxID=156304 RepID=A0AAJ7ND03_9HYME
MKRKENFLTSDDERINACAPFMDDQGLIRTKSKLLYREDNFNFRCPIILPNNDYLVHLLIREKHIELNHAGEVITMNALREKHQAKQVSAHTAPLPLDRVRDALIFEVIGVDFAGPIYLKGGQKAWICLFTCAVYTAVHLELVSSLNVATFLMALQRHISRRGRPSVIYSDNGTNFVGLNNQLRALDYEKIAKTVAIQQIEWKFNPPSAPWWGGFWERLISVLKRLLRRTLKKTYLRFEEMMTTLTDCEAVINSRPITFLSDSQEDIMPLTPSMFLHE